MVIRAARDERETDPNLPPTYDQAVTGKDRSVKVEESCEGSLGQSQGPSIVEPPPPPPQGAPPTASGPLPRFAPPPFSQVPRVQNSTNTSTNTGTFRSYLGNQSAPPSYSHAPPVLSQHDRSDSLDADDQTALLS